MSDRQKHTPGPWMAASGPSSVVGWPVVTPPNGRSICGLSWLPKPAHVSAEEYQAFYEETQSNSHLISAAPDLLEALRNLNAALDAYWNVGPKERGTGGTIKAIEAAQQASKAAIDRAEGRP